MNQEIKLEGDMYGILYELKRKYDIENIKKDFQEFAKEQIEKLYKKGIEMLADEDREDRDEIIEE